MGVREIDMIDDTIIGLLEKFSEINGFEYIRDALPYRPYGKVTGIQDDLAFQIYIYQSESRAIWDFDTVFTTPGLDQVPKGFCIDHNGDPFIQSKSFEELIKIRSHDSEIVTEYMNDNAKYFLLEVFKKINRLENSLFKFRSSLRVSDKEVSLSVGRLFRDIEELNEAFLSVMPLLKSVTEKLPRFQKEHPLTTG